MIKYILNEYEGIDNKNNIIRLEPNFEKVAYQFGDPIKEFIEKNIKPTKGSNYYLINAMGSGEIYGANTRGDYFPRKELIENHKTFETTPAHVFVQHRNKDKSRRLGDVLFSYFNEDTDRVELVQRIDWDRVFKYAPDWVKVLLQTDQPYSSSMGCLIGTSKINTLEGLKEIKDIREGDLVKTHTGAWKKVTRLFSKYFNEGIYTIKVQSLGKEFKVTYEHPFLILPKEKVKNKWNSFIYDSETLEPEWIKTQDLRVGDYACYVFNTDIEEDPEATPEFARLLGWYLSDGYIHLNGKNKNPNNIEIVLGKGEERYIEEIQNLVGEEKTKLKTFDTFYRLYIYDSKLASKLLEYSGRGCKTKKVSQKVMKWSPELQLELLGAFINGDGFLYDNCTHFEIANYELAMQLCEMAARNGITWTIQEIKHTANENSICKTGSESICWQVQFCKKYNKKLASVTDKSGTFEDKNYPDRKFIWKNYIFSPITKIEFDDSWEGMIYNFEVEEDESYVADNVVVHNCTVDYEYCSYCGKKNKLMNQRCDHLNNHMNQFIDGVRVYAVNIKPKFFDNSIVMRGADRIARSIKKVASDPYEDGIFNSEETIMNDNELRGRSYFIIDSKKSNKLDFSPAPETKVAFIREETFDKIASDSFYLSKDFIDSMLESELKDILGVTKLAGAELLPHEYQYIVLKKLGQDEEAERRWNYGVRFKLQDTPTEKIDKLA